VPKSKNAPFFGAFLLFGTRKVEEHEEHALVGVFFVFWRRGMGGYACGR